jgi:tRNA dimethylallyltransferase
MIHKTVDDQRISNNQQPTTNNYLIAIMGPTASGKTGLAIQLAQAFKTEIISVDSRQFYREMNVGTAKPTASQLGQVKHHFIDNLSVTEEYTAGHFARDAQTVIKDLFTRHNIVIAVGGSTLYYKALLEGIDDFPDISPAARERVNSIDKSLGIIGLQAALKQADPEYYRFADTENSRRLVRALEVSYSGPHAYSFYLNRKQYVPDYQIVKIGLNPNREYLYKIIDSRCDEMITNGLVEEVKALLPYKHLKPLHTVGYTEFFDYLDGKYGLEEAINLFKQHTRNYAKRQMTWLRKEKDIKWFAAPVVNEVFDYIGRIKR